MRICFMNYVIIERVYIPKLATVKVDENLKM